MLFFGGLYLVMGLLLLSLSTLTKEDWILRATLPFKLLGEKAAQIVLRVLGVLFILLGLAVLIGGAVGEADRQAVLGPTATAARATYEVREVQRATAQAALATTETIQNTAEAAQKTATARILLTTLYLEGGYSCQEVSYSPDGTEILIIGEQALFIWTWAEEGHVVRTLTFDEGLREGRGPSTAPTIGDASYSPDGRSLAAIGRSGVLNIWDTQTWQPLRMLSVDPDDRGFNHPKLVFSPDGQRIATWSGSSFGAMVWDADTGKRAFTLGSGKLIEDLAYSLDGQNILTIGGAGGTLQIWDAHTGKQVGSRNIGGNYVAYSADGHKVVVTSRYDRTTTILDADTWESDLVIQNDNYGPDYATLSPDGHHLITIDDRDATMWDATTGEEIATLKHNNRIQFALYSPDGRHIVTLSRCWVMVWDATALQEGGEFRAEYD